MLKKQYRLPANIRFTKPSSQNFSNFILKSEENSLPYSRFAFVISKNVDSRAVVRNKIKRQMTTTVSTLLEKVSGKDFIYILKRNAVDSLDNLKEEVERSLSK